MNALLTALAWAAGLGAVLPTVVALVVKAHWPGPVKAAIALLSSLIVGTGTAIGTGQFTGLGWLGCAAVAVAASQTAYVAYWKASGIAPWIETHIFPGANVLEGITYDAKK